MHKALSNLSRIMAAICGAIIALMPFHAFLTVFGSAIVGHYTLLRLWKEGLLLLLILGVAPLIYRHQDIRQRLRDDRLLWLIAGYGLVLLATFVWALDGETVGLKAGLEGMLLDGRFLLFFVVTYLVSIRTDILVRWWKKLLLIPAALVVGFAALQYALLPHDFLQHFGYGPRTIPPSETVDQKAAYTRIQSTLRGANPFGAYLVLMLAAVGSCLLKARRRRWMYAVFFALAIGALFFTFSRSAWLGAFVALGTVMFAGLRSAKVRRNIVLAAAVFVLVGGAVGYTLRNDDRFQNVFLHTSSHSRSPQSSNQGHRTALADGLTDIVRQPFGRGPGTAGPASVYNMQGPTRIAENYYIQIGQETGVLGLALFLIINALVAIRLWRNHDSQLYLILLASFAGLAVVNMLSHAWTDDTLAYVWWGLAGAALGSQDIQNAPREV